MYPVLHSIVIGLNINETAKFAATDQNLAALATCPIGEIHFHSFNFHPGLDSFILPSKICGK
jgi:hypothetical protein